MNLDVNVTNEQKVVVTANPKTKSGKPANLDGALRVSVASGDGTFTQDPANPLAVTLVSGEGNTVYNFQGDADPGPGESLVPEAPDTVTLHVSAEPAADLGLVAGEPEPK